MITYTIVADAASWITPGSLVAAAAANGTRMGLVGQCSAWFGAGNAKLY